MQSEEWMFDLSVFKGEIASQTVDSNALLKEEGSAQAFFSRADSENLK